MIMMQTWLHKANSTYSRARPKNLCLVCWPKESNALGFHFERKTLWSCYCGTGVGVNGLQGQVAEWSQCGPSPWKFLQNNCAWSGLVAGINVSERLKQQKRIQFKAFQSEQVSRETQLVEPRRNHGSMGRGVTAIFFEKVLQMCSFIGWQPPDKSQGLKPWRANKKPFEFHVCKSVSWPEIMLRLGASERLCC